MALAKVKATVRSVQRQLYELLKNDRYSRPSLHGIEPRLDELFDGPGFFVEAGAFDGFKQSNTYWLERFRGWHGVLIEPLPAKAAACRKRRRASTVQCALVPPGSEGPVTIRYAGLMSLAAGARGSKEEDDRHIAKGQQIQGGLETFEVEVPARTLTEVLADVGAPGHFDLLSLDVEGFEEQVLKGLDVDRFRPEFVLVEVNDKGGAAARLRSMGYTLVDGEFTPRDALWQSHNADDCRQERDALGSGRP